MCSSVGAYTSSRIPSRLPWMMCRGVRSSCATSAVRFRRRWSARCSSETIRLNERANRPKKSALPMGSSTRTLRSPSATASAADMRSATGVAMPRKPTMARRSANAGRARARPIPATHTTMAIGPRPPKCRVSRNATAPIPLSTRKAEHPKTPAKRAKTSPRLRSQCVCRPGKRPRLLSRGGHRGGRCEWPLDGRCRIEEESRALRSLNITPHW